MLITDMKYSYNDISIVPAIKSNIKHRSECCVFKGDHSEGNLPIFTAPMSTVVDEHSFNEFYNNNIIPILPRNFPIETRLKYLKEHKWAAVSLKEFNNLFIYDDWDMKKYPYVNVLIDIANGHMEYLCQLIREARNKYLFHELTIMVGNIANPKTYAELSKAGANFIRLSVGTGSGCITQTNVGIGYPIASLISETYKIKQEMERTEENTAYIVADGGIRNYSDVIKALALGADYVMVGSLFASLAESAGDIYQIEKDGSICEIDDDEKFKLKIEDNWVYLSNGEVLEKDRLFKIFYGMASREGQIDINGKKTKTSEGIKKNLPLTTTISKWVDNMISYMQSAMSYTNCFNIEDFNPNNVDCVVISQGTKDSINK